MTRTAAFFDLDLTMIDCNSALLWARNERETGFISRAQWYRAVFWSSLYYLSVIDMDKAYSAAVAAYRGQSRDDLDARTREWFQRVVVPRTRAGALQALESHRQRGDMLVLLTSSSSFQARAAAEHWGFDYYLANDFHACEEGRMLGTMVRPVCYKEGKVHYAERFAAEHGVDLEGSWFYSDSYSDLPMLERVGNPRVVAPDPRLRLAARARRWPIEVW